MVALIPFLAFLGGVAAVAAKAWLDYLLKRRCELRAFRSAARLIAHEFSSIGVHASVVEEMGEWSEPREWTFDHDVWREHKALLSSNLSYHDWIAVASGYRSARSIETILDWAAPDNGEPWPKLDASNLQLIGLDKRSLEAADNALSWVARTGRSKSQGLLRRRARRARHLLGAARATAPARLRGADS